MQIITHGFQNYYKLVESVAIQNGSTLEMTRGDSE